MSKLQREGWCVMQVDELEQRCRDTIASGGKSVVLVTRSLRLCGSCGPIGTLLCENSDGSKVVAFNAKKVLKFLEKKTPR